MLHLASVLKIQARVCTLHAVDQAEVETLYWRFRSLDKGRKGFVTAEELLGIPGARMSSKVEGAA